MDNNLSLEDWIIIYPDKNNYVATERLDNSVIR